MSSEGFGVHLVVPQAPPPPAPSPAGDAVPPAEQPVAPDVPAPAGPQPAAPGDVPVATPSTTTSTQAPVTPVTANSPLPRTGIELLALLLIATALLILGALLVKAGHVRRHAT